MNARATLADSTTEANTVEIAVRFDTMARTPLRG